MNDEPVSACHFNGAAFWNINLWYGLELSSSYDGNNIDTENVFIEG